MRIYCLAPVLPRIKFTVIQGDIAAQSADILVNAAGTSLQMGSGVAGALRRTASGGINEGAVSKGPVDLGAVAVTDATAGARPPGYRKRGDSHPRSTVLFKAAGFKHDTQFQRVCLSKGRNLKEHRSDFVLCEYELRPNVDLSEWSIQQVRAVYKYGEWRLHFVCRDTIDPEPPGYDTAGIDLGICNVVTLSFGGESILFPGNVLKEDEYYFGKEKAMCDDAQSRKRKRLDQKRTERRKHSECSERGVGTIAVSTRVRNPTHDHLIVGTTDRLAQCSG